MPSRHRSLGLTTSAAVLAVAAAAALAAPLALAAQRRAVGVHLTGRTSLAEIVKPTVLVDRGTISGSPVGSGRITLVYRLHPKAGTASVTFGIVNARGRITGRVRARYAVTRVRITFTGTAALVRGTRAYKGIRGRPLAFDAVHSITGRREVVALGGRATLP